VTTRLLFLAAVLVSGCQQKKPRIDPPAAEDVLRGKEVVGTLKKNLKGALE
jgi:hypothetical protein